MAVITNSLIHAVLLCNIYSSFGNTAHISYIGCFYDTYDPTSTAHGVPRVLPNATQEDDEMTIGTCIKFCTDQSLQMQYAGVETGNECHCGTEEAQYGRYGQRNDNECTLKNCSGNPLQYCGYDFSIAVYNLTLVRCQLPKIQGLDTSNPDFIPVYDNATFACLPGYQLTGPDSVQCIFDDDITDTRWSSGLPQCLSIPATTSTTTRVTTTGAAVGTTKTTGTHSMPDSTRKSDLLSTTSTATTNTMTSEKSSDRMNLQGPTSLAVIGGAVGACVIFVMILVVLVIFRSRRKRKANEATQSHDTPMSPTSNGSTTKTQQKDTSDSFPVYSQPVRPASRGKSLHQQQTNGDVTSPTQEKSNAKTDELYSYADLHKQEKPNAKTDELYSYADLHKQEKPNAKTDELYSYADLRINSPNAAETNKVVSDSTDWEDNNLYSRTEETTDEGWKDNNIYES